MSGPCPTCSDGVTVEHQESVEESAPSLDELSENGWRADAITRATGLPDPGPETRGSRGDEDDEICPSCSEGDHEMCFRIIDPDGEDCIPMTAARPGEPTPTEPVESVRRLSIQAHAIYVDETDDAQERWCVEVGSSGEDGEFWPSIQGWGPDPLAAALACAENAFARTLFLEGVTVEGTDRHGQVRTDWTRR